MARITAGVASSHIPALGATIDHGKTQEPYWKECFAGFAHFFKMKNLRTNTGFSVFQIQTGP